MAQSLREPKETAVTTTADIDVIRALQSLTKKMTFWSCWQVTSSELLAQGRKAAFHCSAHGVDSQKFVGGVSDTNLPCGICAASKKIWGEEKFVRIMREWGYCPVEVTTTQQAAIAPAPSQEPSTGGDIPAAVAHR